MEFPAVGIGSDDSSGTLYYAGAWGHYWSSVAGGSDNAYGLCFGSSSLYVNNYGKRRGFSVRCVR
ncbi:MAG: hypothetical protein K2F53_00740 [Rikenellaceae bacterium]|nr:hypothetical protein [Rikenellaceae bacterium]